MTETLTVEELESLRKWADDVYPSNERRIASGRIVQIIDTALSFAAAREGIAAREAWDALRAIAMNPHRDCDPSDTDIAMRALKWSVVPEPVPTSSVREK